MSTELRGKEYIQTVPIPERLKHLQKDTKGYIIPFFVPVNADGTPNFKYIDKDKQVTCTKGGLCAICGDHLEADVWYISGPKARAQFVSSDPGMHEECARYSLAICPYIHYVQTHRTSTNDPLKKEVVKVAQPVIDINKPEYVHLIQAKNYSLHYQDGYVLSVYHTVMHEEIYHYSKGILELVSTIN